MTTFSLPEFREQFPILKRVINNYPLIYCDNAATTQKPLPVLQAVSHQLNSTNANVHRGAHYLSAQATTLYEQAREKVAHFIQAKSRQQIIWTKGTTESINLLASTIGRQQLSAGDEIVLSVAEHHANIVPWQQLAKQQGASLVILPLDKQGRIDIKAALPLITEKCKFVCVNHASNVLGKINPIETLFARAREVNAITVLDAAQTIAHVPIDVQKLDSDFLVFSAHKMFGPAGLGVLYGRQSLLEQMPPYQLGGEMIKTVTFEHTEFNTLPHKFEAGTPNLTAVIAMGACIDFLQSQQFQQSLEYERELISYAYQKLADIPGLNWLVEACPDLPIFSFILQSGHHQDLATYLDSNGIAVRSGHHCAMPLMQHLHIPGSVRISLAPYNSFDEVDKVVAAIGAFVDAFDEGESNEQKGELNPVELVTADSAATDNDSWLAIKQRFDAAKGWDAKHREIMLLGKSLVRMAKSDRADDLLISGCESNAWLKITDIDSGHIQFSADSDARVIRGLLNIILTLVNQKSAQQILTIDFSARFEDLGLMQHLSPSRGNGLLAIVEQIQRLAQQQLDKE